MGNGESYQFRHIFFELCHWSFSLETVVQFTPLNFGTFRRRDFGLEVFSLFTVAQILRGIPFFGLHFSPL